MNTSDIISLVALTLFWIGSLLGFWIRIRIKLTELELKMNNNHKQFEQHVTDSNIEKMKINERVDGMVKENKLEHKELSIKMDRLLQGFNDFKLYVEQTFSK